MVLTASCKIHLVIHVSLLKPAKAEESESTDGISLQTSVHCNWYQRASPSSILADKIGAIQWWHEDEINDCLERLAIVNGYLFLGLPFFFLGSNVL